MASWRRDDPQRPSPTLAEYLADRDPNAFWHLASGDHENLLDEAVDALRDIAALGSKHRQERARMALLGPRRSA